MTNEQNAPSKTYRDYLAEGWKLTHASATEYVLRRGARRVVLQRPTVD